MQALSQTEWITCYSINPEKGCRIGYKLTIIDTPGFGDTRGIQRDQHIVDQIRELFSDKGEKGVFSIDAVCFIVKAPDARLTTTQTYIYHAIMSLFGKDIETNICSLITFADGEDPPVLAALEHSELPFGRHFTFNNSGLFTKNVQYDSLSLASIFWDMGCKSFRAFFDHIETMQTKSLQLTKQVLVERMKLETTVQNLQPQVDAGLSKLNELKIELQLLDQYRTEIERNKDFEYEVMETHPVKTELPKGKHVTNCLNCNITCHTDCAYAIDDDKAKCSAMGKDGNCVTCTGKCHWSQHHNTPYIFDFVSVKKRKTYENKLDKYQKVEGKRLTQKTIIHKISDELDKIENCIMQLMKTVKECKERLEPIALLPTPLNVIRHIDMMIEAEQMERREGFGQRIGFLREFRNRAHIEFHVHHFSEEVFKTRSTMSRVLDTCKSKKG